MKLTTEFKKYLIDQIAFYQNLDEVKNIDKLDVFKTDWPEMVRINKIMGERSKLIEISKEFLECFKT